MLNNSETERIIREPSLINFVSLGPDEQILVRPILVIEPDEENQSAVEVTKIVKPRATDSEERVDSMTVSREMLKEAKDWLPHITDDTPQTEIARLSGISRELLKIFLIIEPNLSSEPAV